MNRNQILGIARELLVSLAAILVIYQVGDSALWDLIVPAALALVSLVLGIRANDGFEALNSAIRKFLVAGFAVAVRVGWLPQDAVMPLITMALSCFTIYWSLAAKSDNSDMKPPGGLGLWIVLALCLPFLPSCATRYGEVWMDAEGNLNVMMPYRVLK